MNRLMRILSMLVSFTLLIPGCAYAQPGGQSIEMFAVNVGKGDAIIIRVDGHAYLIDAGKAHARGRIIAAMEYMSITAFDAVFLTHTDDDHGEGLEWISASDIPVGSWYASGMYTGVKEKKHPAVKAAGERNANVIWLNRGDVVPLGDTGAVFEVLAPASLNTDKDDNNSLVMMLRTAQGNILLTGDMELVQESQLLSFGDDLKCSVLKVPNHADNDTTSAAFAAAAAADVAVISTSTLEKPETPDNGVLRRLNAAGSRCVITQEAGTGLYITLADGKPNVEYVSADAQTPFIRLHEVVAGDDVIVLYNENPDNVDLSGWYLFSDKGEEMFVFPQGVSIAGGSTLIVGTESSEDDDHHIIWPDKKVINKSKTDVITLYDRYGMAVDSLSNGY